MESDSTIATWEQNWWLTDPATPEAWWLDVDTGFKTVVGLCYGPEPNIPPVPVNGDGFRVFEVNPYSIRPDYGASLGLLPDRLSFVPPSPTSELESGGLGILYIGMNLTNEDRIWTSCGESRLDRGTRDYYESTRLALGQFGPADQDSSKHFVVAHSPIIRN